MMRPASLAGRRVLVTGGAGFIGSHLVEQLVERGARVTVVDDLSTGRTENLQRVCDAIELVVSDLNAACRERRVRVDEFDLIFHLAANPYIPPSVENPVFDFQLNLVNTLALLEGIRLAEPRPRLVNASSAAVYGNPARLPIVETDPTVPISPYGVSKLGAERYVAVYSELYGITATSLRFFSVFGPRQHKQVAYDFIRRLRAGVSPLPVIGDGTQSRDFCYVTDIVQALVIAATVAPGQGEVYNVASGATHTIAELVDACCRVTGAHPPIAYSGQTRPGDAEKWSVDISALSALGFSPRVTLEQGLAEIVKWFDAGAT